MVGQSLQARGLKVYLAGPLFSPSDRGFLDDCARRLTEAGLECFVPHQAARGLEPLTAGRVFEVDYRQGLLSANALLAWLDGPMVDDGTACEIGLFYGLMQQDPKRRKGIVGLATDLRLERRRAALEHAGLNLFVAGLLERSGGLCWSLEEALERLLAWQRELAG